MEIVWTSADIERLCHADRFAPAYLGYASDLFKQLRESLADPEEEACFTLADHGPIVLLERGDDVRHLKGVGLDEGHDGLLGTWPEYVQVSDLGHIAIYQIFVLYDNEYGPIFLSIRSQLDPEAESWLEDHSE